MRKLVSLSLLAILVASTAHAGATLGAPFTLKVGQSLVVAGTNLTLGFDRVTGDSRCPSQFVCIWEGDAASAMWGEVGDKHTDFTLHTSANFQRSATVSGYRVLLLWVDPYPFDDTPIDPDAYVATLMVTLTPSVPLNETTWGHIKALYR